MAPRKWGTPLPDLPILSPLRLSVFGLMTPLLLFFFPSPGPHVRFFFFFFSLSLRNHETTFGWRAFFFSTSTYTTWASCFCSSFFSFDGHVDDPPFFFFFPPFGVRRSVVCVSSTPFGGGELRSARFLSPPDDETDAFLFFPAWTGGRTQNPFVFDTSTRGNKCRPHLPFLPIMSHHRHGQPGPLLSFFSFSSEVEVEVAPYFWNIVGECFNECWFFLPPGPEETSSFFLFSPFVF